MRFVMNCVCAISILLSIFSQAQAISTVTNMDRTVTYISEKCNQVSRNAIRDALTAYNNAHELGLDAKGILTIVDYSKPATDDRLCTVDLNDKDILYTGIVAHGLNSGGQFSTNFSNSIGSNESSLGLFLTGDPYYGVAGHSLTLYGLDKGLNDNAAARHVVMHGLRHDINPKKVVKMAHTLGCFGINKSNVDKEIDQIKGGTLLFAYYPSNQLNHSVFLTDASGLPQLTFTTI